VNFAVRQAMMDRYDSQFPSSNAALQKSCAEGQTPVAQCPGNRRWVQLMYDAWLLMPQAPSMVDARDAMLAADQIRFGGADLATLWAGFARTGLGNGAVSAGSNDGQPTPSFSSPMTSSPTITFAPETKDGTPISGAQIFVGDYEARATPIADTDLATPLGDSAPFIAGTYDVVVRAPGFGELRTTLTVRNNRPQTKTYNLGENLASSANGATAAGDGVNQASLIDDTEATNWAFVGQSTSTPVAGKQVTVHLDPSKSSWTIQRVQVSAMLRPAITGDPDAGGQSRFSALRQFAIQTCLVKRSVDCSSPDQFSTVFTSPSDAFPSGLPRPRAPELIVRSFAIPKSKATFVRLVVLTNQCTGGPAYAGDQDDDPANTTDCTAGSPQAFNVRAAELQVFQK
jgi:extracellular elastinolytic metalloproteinase